MTRLLRDYAGDPGLLKKGARTVWAAILLVLALFFALACLLYPIYVIRPFRAQGARELALALAVMHYRGVAAFVWVTIALGATVVLVRAAASRWTRVAAVTGSVLVVACAVLSRVNIYELMFKPNLHPAFSPASVTKLDADEKVVAVRVGSTARAYPIRSMAYHHILNDVVGGLPLVATY